MYAKRVKSSDALAVTLTPDKDILVDEVRLHLAAVGGGSAGTFYVSLDSQAGEEFDVVFNSQDMASVADEHYLPTRPIHVRSGDTLSCTWTNTNGIMWGLEILWR